MHKKCLKIDFLKGQSLTTKLVIAIGYNLTQYLFIRSEF